MKLQLSIFLVPCSILFLCCCSVSHKISKEANSILLKDTAIREGHIGISIYEPETGKYWYNYNADKYFIPASNTKLFTLYAGMKYLGDSLVGLRYYQSKDSVYAFPAADPTLLVQEFPKQPVADFFSKAHSPIIFTDQNWKSEKYGNGWAWDDYNDDYMAERNSLPVYGNLLDIYINSFPPQYTDKFIIFSGIKIQPIFFRSSILYTADSTLKIASAKRKEYENIFKVNSPHNEFAIHKKIPFITNGISSSLKILHNKYPIIDSTPHQFYIFPSLLTIIHSQPSDSLFKPMMHNSDNFFAEQTLLMASNERLGYMSDTDMIDTLLKNDLKDIPQRPKWVDGSGLSRYNLFTPASFIYILEKLKNEFGLERLKTILPTGGEGSLKNYFKKDSSNIFAKTGTLSNNCALSGYLVTEKGKLLIFSILVNNYQTSAAPVRMAMEHFLQEIRKKN